MSEKSFGVKEIKIDGSGTPSITSPSGGNLNITAATATFSQNVHVTGDLTIPDDKQIKLGNSTDDFNIEFDPTDNRGIIKTGSRPIFLDSGAGLVNILSGGSMLASFGSIVGFISYKKIVPDTDGTLDLGIGPPYTPTYKWKDLFLSGTANTSQVNASGICTASHFYGDGSNLTGITVSTADNATKVNIQENNGGIKQVVFCAQNGTGNQDLYIDTNDDHLSYNPNLGRLYTPNYTGGSGGLSGSGLHHLSSTTINRAVSYTHLTLPTKA